MTLWTDWAPGTAPRPANRLRLFAAALIVLNGAATLVAVVLNLPSQFGQVGTDATAEFLNVGTAISAPLAPVVLLLLVISFAGCRGAAGLLGVVAAYLTALAVAVGGAGEILAEPTVDTPRAVLVGAGLAWLGIAGVLVHLATTTLRSRPGLPFPSTGNERSSGAWAHGHHPRPEVAMSFSDKMGNKAEDLGGKAKESYGKATDDESMEAEGKADQGEASIKNAGEHVKDAAKDVKDGFSK